MTIWLPTDAASALLGVTERWIRQAASSGRYGEPRRTVRGRNANAIEVALENLPADAQVRYLQAHPDLTRPALADAAGFIPPTLSFENATENQRQRASCRMAAVVAFDLFTREWGSQRGVREARERWVEQYRAANPDVGAISRSSLERWSTAYRTYGIDGLVDRIDGSSRRDKGVIPERARAFFWSRYTDGEQPSIADAIRDTRMWAEEVVHVELPAADNAFYRLAEKIPDAVRRATREDQDHDERWLVTIRRDYNFPALKIVQADHHITDLWVSCGGTICGPDGCKHGHRVWTTVFIDVASRAVVSWIASLSYPNSDTILRALRQLIEAHGLPEIVYVDNGKDFKSAFGRAIRRGEATPFNDDYLNNLLASLGVRIIFAIPRRARSKNIERLFGTWVRQIWSGNAAYVGALGKRTERSAELYKHPEQLLDFESFRALLTAEIDRYNMRRGHRGQAMSGRSPLEVLAETRIPRRDPDEKGFALAFWHYHARQVRAGGRIVVGQNEYQIAEPAIALAEMGRNVQLLVNPEDVRRAIVLTGCQHTTSKLDRSRSIACGCAGKGAFLCEATLWGLSTYDTDDPITVGNLKEEARINKELRRQVRFFGNLSAHRDLASFKANRFALLQAIAERERGANRQLLAKAEGERSGATVLLPQSSIARRLEEYRDRLDGAGLITPADRQLAAAITPPPLYDLAALAALHRVHDEVRSTDEEEPAGVTLTLANLDDERRRREREDAGFCSATLDCPNAAERGPFCLAHHHELVGD